MMKLPKIAAATVLFACLANTDANAASENFCNEYAGTSVEQFNRAQELALSVSGPRWHGAFDLHKVWCRIVSKAAAQHEINERQAVLDEGETSADAEEPPFSEHAGDPPLPDAAEPPLSAPVDTPSRSGSEEEPGSALSDGGPPLSAPVGRPPSDAEEPPSSDEGDPPSSGLGEPPPSEGGLLWEPAD